MSETVKLIIEIPKEKYEHIKTFSDVVPDTYSSLVKSGIPLSARAFEILKNIGKTGEWIYQGDEISGELKCSVCGNTVGMDGENYRICPYCGSVMKVEKDFSQRGEQNET